MTKAAAYDDDIVLWAEHQAEVLRSLSGRPGVPNELDVENIAEEIETVGRNEIRAAESYVRLIFLHLVKAASEPDSPARGHWRAEVSNWRQDLIDALTPSMGLRIDLDRLWKRAQSQARPLLEEQGVAIAENLPRHAPVSLDDLAGDDFDFDAAVIRIMGRR